MKNSFQKQKKKLLSRWLEEDYPGGTPRFQLSLLTRDVVVFFLIPIVAILCFKIAESAVTGPKRPVERRRQDTKIDRNEKRSQIIQFQPSSRENGNLYSHKRSPGTLVRVRLMNVVETYSNAPVHAQIIDTGLGKEFMGGTLIGDATADNSIGRIRIDFRFARRPDRVDLASAINARAISLDGTFGLVATKKEGMFARAAIRSSASNTNAVDTDAKEDNFKTLIARAIASGFMQELQSESTVAQKNAEVLTLKPMTEFFVELTDFFPGKK